MECEDLALLRVAEEIDGTLRVKFIAIFKAGDKGANCLWELGPSSLSAIFGVREKVNLYRNIHVLDFI